jgi:hypothetical protein
LYNEGIEAADSQLLKGGDLTVSQEGLSAALSEDGLLIHVRDKKSRQTISFDSGLDPARFLRNWNLRRGTCQYLIFGRGHAWSTDGTRLLIQAHIASSYFWGFQGVMTNRPLTPGAAPEATHLDRGSVTMLWTPWIHFDIVMVFAAD